MKKTKIRLSLAKETLRTLDGNRSLQRARGGSLADCQTEGQVSCGPACTTVCTVAGGCPSASCNCTGVSVDYSNCGGCSGTC
jgi:hypothetical protein